MAGAFWILWKSMKGTSASSSSGSGTAADATRWFFTFL